MRTLLVSISAIALVAAIGLPVAAEDAMSSSAIGGDAMMSGDSSMMAGDAMAGDSSMMAGDAMSGGAMSGDAMSGDHMMADGMMMNDMAMANDMSDMGMAMMMKGKAVMITIEDLTKGQPFSPSVFESHSADAAPLFKLGDKASDALVAVAEGGNIGMFSVMAAMNKESKIGDAQLAIHTLPGQTRSVIVHVDAKHPLIDAAWMLGNTNDGFSGFVGVDAFHLKKAMTLEVRGYDAGSEKNNEKKGFLGALGARNDRDPENGVITWHTGIRGDADAPKDWNWDVSGPVAKVTITPLP
ncbi:MAG: spondin domain-containing protein [Devosia sp.]